MNTVWRFLKKLGIKSPYDPAVLLLSIYHEETRVEKDTCIPLFIAALFTIARTWKQPRSPSTDEWIKKLWYIYTKNILGQLRLGAAWELPDKHSGWTVVKESGDLGST